MRQNPHVRICGGPGSATTLVYPTSPCPEDAILSSVSWSEKWQAGQADEGI